ncbi:MAG: alkaline phosphatase family protein [Candidatus Glassbacteria bacterium]
MNGSNRIYHPLLTIGLVITCSIVINVSCRPSHRPPRLVLLLVLDGFRADYFDRFLDIMEPGGLRTLYEEGTVFTNAEVDYFFTATGPGHASVATGCYPSRTGIVSNYWWDKELGEVIGCVQDGETGLLGAGDREVKGASPKYLRGPHLSEIFKTAFGDDAKVFSVSAKDRSAVLLGGGKPDGVFWFSDELGIFTTSTWYTQKLPEWVERFNQEENLSRFEGGQWNLLLPAKGWAKCRDDEYEFETNHNSMGIVFPHPLGEISEESPSEFYNTLANTPLIDEYTCEFAMRLVEEEGLGLDEVCDLLCVSFTGPDRIGENYGPFSLEMGDAIWRIDRVVSRMLEFLSGKLDLENECLIVLTSDHGMAPIPEFSRESGERAGRIIVRLTGESGNLQTIAAIVDGTMDSAFGQADWVLSDVIPFVYLNEDAAEILHTELESVVEKARSVLLDRDGIRSMIRAREIETGSYPDKDLLVALGKLYFPERCGELILNPEPYFVYASAKNALVGGTNHGSMYDYDARIPLVFYGWRMGSSMRGETVHQVDILPSLVELLEIETEEAFDGKPLF